MKVDLHSTAGTLEIVELPVEKVEPFIDLVKKYGYMDKDGNFYKFEKAWLEPFEIVCVSLEDEENSEEG